MHGQQHKLTRIVRMIDQACTRARLVKLRMCEVKRVTRKWPYIAETSGAHKVAF